MLMTVSRNRYWARSSACRRSFSNASDAVAATASTRSRWSVSVRSWSSAATRLPPCSTKVAAWPPFGERLAQRVALGVDPRLALRRPVRKLERRVAERVGERIAQRHPAAERDREVGDPRPREPRAEDAHEERDRHQRERAEREELEDEPGGLAFTAPTRPLATRAASAIEREEVDRAEDASERRSRRR